MQPKEFAELEWSADLPTVSGHYFVDDAMGPGYEWIDVTDGVATSLDNNFDRFVYEKSARFQYFGPVLIPEPPVLPQQEVIPAANQIDGEDFNV